MAAVTKYTLKCKFADDTTQTITIDNLNPATSTTENAINTAASKIIAFNNNNGGTLSNKMLSKNGFNWTAITEFTITTTDKTYIF